MAAAKHWVALSTVSVLGVGLLAAGAIGVANAMPLVDSASTAEVPPISTLPEQVAGVSEPPSGIIPVPASTADDAPVVDTSPPPAPSPVAPAPAAPTGGSSSTPVSPASVDDDSND